MLTIFKKTISVALCVSAVLGMASCSKKQDGAAETTNYVVADKYPAGAEVSEREIVSGDFKYTLYSDGNATINAYTGTDSTLAIPESIDSTMDA